MESAYLKELIQGIRAKLIGNKQEQTFDFSEELEKHQIHTIATEKPVIDKATREPKDFLVNKHASFHYFLENGVDCWVNYARDWKLISIHAHVVSGVKMGGITVKSLKDIHRLIEWIKKQSTLENNLSSKANLKELKAWFIGKGIQSHIEVGNTLLLENGTKLYRNHINYKNHNNEWIADWKTAKGIKRIHYPNIRSAASCEALRMMDEKGTIIRKKSTR